MANPDFKFCNLLMFLPRTDVEREIVCEDTERFVLSERNLDQVTR